MPPPMPNPSKRMTANPAKPVARYRPGKALREESLSEEDESEDDDEKPQLPPRQAPPKASSFSTAAQRRIIPPKTSQKEESEDEEGFVTEDEDEVATGGVAIPDTTFQHDRGIINSKAPAIPISRTTESAAERSTEGEESEETEQESEEEEESSSEEEPRRKFQRPTFIQKSDRGKATSTTDNVSGNEGQNGTTSTSPALDATRAEELRRKELADIMIKDKLEKDVAARAAGRKGWDDDDEVAPEDVVDDTDGLDPEAEYTAWKLRELKRLKRDREAIEQREKEIEEIERRRNLTQAEREAEDREYLEQQKEEREEGRGKAGFLQRYHHKGAFFQDDETAEILRKRDLMGAKFVDEVRNREALPQYMRVRDMTKLGKKGRTRYTDLKGEDTGKWGQGYDEKRKGPKMDFGVDERFRPDHDGGSKGPTGANASAIRDRRDRKVDGAPEGPWAMRNGDQTRDADRQADTYRPRRRSIDRGDDEHGRSRQRDSPPRRRRSPSRSRSKSTGRYRRGDDDGRSRRKRSPSPYRDRNSDKRQRIESS